MQAAGLQSATGPWIGGGVMKGAIGGSIVNSIPAYPRPIQPIRGC